MVRKGEEMKYLIYTDGSTRNNGKTNAVGGWAYVILTFNEQIPEYYGRDQNSGAELNTTNQRMELTAAINALKSLNEWHLVRDEDGVVVFSDSAYLINCYKQNWWVNWEKNGWKNSKKQPVANKDLWERLIPFFKDERIKWEKVKGHENDVWNCYVDNLAQNASAKYRR